MSPLQNKKHCIIDLDGVVWRNESLIPGAIQAIEKIESTGREIIYVSNNSSMSHEQALQKIRHFRIEVASEQVIISTRATAKYIKNEFCDPRVFVLGSAGLTTEIVSAGLQLVSDPEQATILVAGYDSGINYTKLTQALRALLAGAMFIATNQDGILPAENGFLPGAGAVIGAVSGMINREPDVVVGKPSELLLKDAMSQLEIDPDGCVMVGDSLHSDVLLAEKLGMTSVLVLSGNTRTRGDISISPVKPQHVISSIAELPKLFVGS